MVLRGLRGVLLRVLALLVVVSSLSSVLLAPTTALAADGKLVIELHTGNLSGPQVTPPGAVVTGKLMGSSDYPATLNFSLQGNVYVATIKNAYDQCNSGDLICSYMITVKDASGNVIGSDGPVQVGAGTTPFGVIVTDLSQNATVKGIVKVKDPNENNAERLPGCDTKVELDKPDGSIAGDFTMACHSDGSFNITGLGIAPGPYTLNISGSYNSAAAQTDLPFTTYTQSVTLKAGVNDLGTIMVEGSSNKSDSTPAQTCKVDSFGWAICGLINITVGAIDWLRDTLVVPLLKEQPLDKDFTAPDGSKPYAPVYTLWSAFRNVATVFFILIFFLIIFGTALGLDNYTVKKTLPRLIAGAILVPFSWYICAIVIDIGNVLGQGILALTSSVIPNVAVNFQTNVSSLVLGSVLVAGASIAISAIATVGLATFISMFLALLAAFLTLIFRKILIILLVILSPLALLAWILPNTQKWYKTWWNNLIRLVLMYPLIILLFEVGRLFSYASSSITGQAGAAVKPLFQLAGLYAPLALAPKTPGWVGGFMTMGKGAINKLTGSIDKKVGKESAWAKDRNAERERRNLIKEKDANTAGHRFRAMAYRARSGTGSGFGGLTSGNFQAVMRREDARTKAMQATGMYNAQRQSSSELPQESATDRIAYEQRVALDKLAADRGQRAGVRTGLEELGTNSRNISNTRYNAAFTNARRGYGEEIGKARGIHLAEDAINQTAADVAEYAMDVEAEHGAQLRGKMAGHLLAASHIDRDTVAKGGALTTRGAQFERVMAAGVNAEIKGREAMAETHGTIVGENRVDASLSASNRKLTLDTATATAINAEKKRSEVIGSREGALVSAAADRASMIARGVSNVDTARIQEQIGVAAEHTEEKMSAEAGARAVQLAARHRAEAISSAEGRNYHNDIVTAASVRAKKDADKHVGETLGLIDSRAQQNMIGDTDIAAARITTSREESSSAGERRGIVEGAQDLDRRLMARGMTLEQARRAADNTIAAAAQINMRERTNQRVADAAGTIEGMNAAQQRVIDDAAAAGRTLAPAAAAASVMGTAAASAQAASKNKFIDTYGQRRAQVNADSAYRIDDQTRLSAAEYQAGKREGAAAGDIRGAINAAAAEAGRDSELLGRTVQPGSIDASIASIRRSAQASAVNAKDKYSKAFANEQATINVNGTSTGFISASDIAKQAEREANVNLARSVNVTKGSLTEQDLAEQKVIAEMKKAGTAPTGATAERVAAQEQIMATAGTVARHKGRMDTGKMYEDDRGAAAGLQQQIAKAQQMGREAGDITFSSNPDIAKKQAEEYMYKTIRDQSERTGYNRVVGDYAEARGIKEARERQKIAAMEDIAREEGKDMSKMTAAERQALADRAGARIDDAGDATIAKQTRDKIMRSTGDELGTLRDEQHEIEKEADRLIAAKGSLDPATARRQARQNLATNIVRAAAATADVSGAKETAKARATVEARDEAIDHKIEQSGGTLTPAQAQKQILADIQGQARVDNKLNEANAYGIAEGSAQTAEAAVTKEMQNTINEDWTVGPGGVRLEDGTLVPEGTFLRKGTTLFNPPPPGISTIDRDEAARRITRKAVRAGSEQGIRNQAARQAQVAAYNQAVGRTAHVEERLDAYTQAELDKLAGETGNIQAQAQIIGTPMQRGFEQAVRETTSTAFDREVENKVKEAKERKVKLYEVDENGKPILNASGNPIESTVESRIGNIPINDEGAYTLKQIARKAKDDKDYATLFASLRQLGTSDTGRDHLVEMRNELFGGANFEEYGGKYGVEDFNVKAITGEPLELWDRVMEGVKAPGSQDLIKPDSSAFGNMDGKKLASMDNKAVQRYTEYIDRLRESAKRAMAASLDTSLPLDERKDARKKAEKLWDDREKAIKQLSDSRKQINENPTLSLEPAAVNSISNLLDKNASILHEWSAVSPMKEVQDRYDKYKLPTTPPDPASAPPVS